ncbi:hypothetical protein QR98_0072580 [Sarcoptes scabiei]|uniref:Uncharacterized protein n=1 Tax=Sarcoptes scabiei TaxID=52283 RepID=A0A132ACL4_SARSC|nr:hypothetical protein QR98_0072580 [Sarcoptes scabiei]
MADGAACRALHLEVIVAHCCPGRCSASRSKWRSLVAPGHLKAARLPGDEVSNVLRCRGDTPPSAGYHLASRGPPVPDVILHFRSGGHAVQ